MEDSITDSQISAGDPSQAVPATVTLPTREHVASEDEANDRGEKRRRKLNLWKCKPCRYARQKCFPEDRVWPQKCNRCLQHRPHPLDCSEPELSTRKRGPNMPKITRPPPRPRNQPTSERQMPPGIAEDENDSEDGSSDDLSLYERPKRTLMFKSIKREHPLARRSSDSRSPSPSGISPPPSLYLPLEEGEFRILQLAPGRTDDKIVCSFVIASKHKLIEYEAISYIGRSDNTLHHKSVGIHLQDSQGIILPVYIRSNLHAALRNLRHPGRVMSFWADGLCVNHNDTAEKIQSVIMRQFVFRNAKNVCLWLGDDESYRSALKFISRILDFTGFKSLVRDREAIEGWAAFVALLKNPVFSRLHLIQEIAVARNVTVHCGGTASHYNDLVEAVAVFFSFQNEISNVFRQNGRNYKELVSRKLKIAETFINVSTNALRTTSLGETERLLSLEALVSQLSELSSEDPHDRIFSVLALARDEDLAEDLRIDYDKKPSELYIDFVLHSIQTSNSLDIICRNWSGRVDNVPNWVYPRYWTSHQNQSEIDSNELIDAVSLVGLPDYNYYHASRGTKATFRISPKDPSGDASLYVRGFSIDTIAKICSRAPAGVILQDWLKMGACVPLPKLDAPPIVETFWRTLVADRGPNGSRAPVWYARAFTYCLHQLTSTGDLNTNRIISELENEGDVTSLVLDFLQRVKSVIWNRRLFTSEEHGWMGLAPTAARIGDIICILYGCSVPVILRPFFEGEIDDGETYFLFVGECYVHGMMDGEAIERAHEFKEMEFELQ